MRAPASPEAARARYAVAAIFLVNGALVGSWAPLIPFVANRLAIGTGTLGLALLGIAVGAMVAMPLAGAVMSRVGSAPVIRVAVAASAIALILPVFAPSVSLLAAALIAFGAANGMLDVSMNAHGVMVENRLARPVMSSFHGMFSLGGFLGAGAAALLLKVLPPGGFAIVSACGWGLIGLVAVAFLMPGRADAGTSTRHFAVPNRTTLALGALTFLALMSEGAILDWSAIHLRSLSADPEVAALGFALFSASMAVGRFLGDRIRARLGAVPLVRWSALLAAVSLGVGLALGSVPVAIVGFAFAGFGIANMIPVLFGAAGRAKGVSPATGIAAVATLGYTGFLAGPPAIGFVAEVVPIGTALGIVVAACAMIALAAGAAADADRA